MQVNTDPATMKVGDTFWKLGRWAGPAYPTQCTVTEVDFDEDDGDHLIRYTTEDGNPFDTCFRISEKPRLFALESEAVEEVVADLRVMISSLRKDLAQMECRHSALVADGK